MYKIGDVLELTQDCELGAAPGRCVVISVESAGYMQICFPHRSAERDRYIRTGTDYKFLRKV